MDRLSFLPLLRGLLRRALPSALNIFGLAIGIAAFVVMMLEVQFQLSFETWLPNAKHIYVLQDEWRTPGASTRPSQATMGALLDQLQQAYPGLVGTRVKETNATVLSQAGPFQERLQLVDPAFPRVLRLPTASGTAELADPASVLVSEAIARRYYQGRAVGRSLTLNVEAEIRRYRIVGVLRDAPSNSDMRWDIVAPLAASDTSAEAWSRWGNESVTTYLTFASTEEANHFQSRLENFVATRAGALGDRPETMLRLTLLPLRARHLADPDTATGMTTLGVIALLTLGIAIVNYVNLTTAQSGLRAREVAMRKVLGATPARLRLQFLGEALAVSLLAGLVALAMVEWAVPTVNALAGTHLRLIYLGEASILPWLAGLVALVGLVAGAYPAFVLSRFQPAPVLAASRTQAEGRHGARLREGLVVLQFTLAITLLTCTAVVMGQMLHLRAADIGYDRDTLLLVPSFASPELSESARNGLLQSIRGLPGVRSVTISSAAPGDETMVLSTTVRREGVAPNLTIAVVGPEWRETYGARLVTGRWFDAARQMDDGAGRSDDVMQNVVVNRTAVRALGFTEPRDAIDAIISDGAAKRIIGVVEDMRFYSPRRPLPPTMYLYRSRDVPAPIATVRLASAELDGVLETLRSRWRELAPQAPLVGVTANAALDRYYRQDTQVTRLLGVGAGLAVIIACVGLWGLASFSSTRRFKEIGIRMTLGASRADILKLLIGQLLRPIALAAAIAMPLSYALARHWLAAFDDRIDVGAAYLLGPSVAAVFLALATVAGHAVTASRTSPALALRQT